MGKYGIHTKMSLHQIMYYPIQDGETIFTSRTTGWLMDIIVCFVNDMRPKMEMPPGAIREINLDDYNELAYSKDVNYWVREGYSYISFFKTNNPFSKTSKTMFRYKKSDSPVHREGYGFDNYFHAWAYFQRLCHLRGETK